MVRKEQLPHVYFDQVPWNYSSNLKELEKNSQKKDDEFYNYYQVLLQITIEHHAIIYNISDLDKGIEEVQYLDNLGSFMDYNTYLETGFILTKSQF